MEDFPFTSVIIPVYNEENYLREIFERILDLDYPENKYEVLIIDNSSTDGSFEVASSYAASDHRVKVYRFDENRSVGEALAYGVEKARGKFVAKIDADCLPPRNWLRMVKHLEGNVAVVGFPVIPPPDLEYLGYKYGYRGKGLPLPRMGLHGTCVIMRRDIVIQAGNYPFQRVGEDTELFKNIRSRGYEIVLVEEIRILHRPKQKNLNSMLRRFYRSGEYTYKDPRTILLFSVILPILLLTTFISLLHSSSILLLSSFIPLLLLLTNPLAVKRYINSFERPRNMIAKVLLFTSIKFLMSLSFILGVWKGIITSLKPRHSDLSP